MAENADGRHSDDEALSEITALLRRHGAETFPHAAGRTLLAHLLGTHAVIRRWGAPSWLQRAALIHSVYGTDAYGHRLVPVAARAELAAAAGEAAERLAYAFCVTPRGPLLAGTRHWAPDLPLVDREDDAELAPLTRGELDALVLLHMANMADQARSGDGSPGRWLARAAELAELWDDAARKTGAPGATVVAAPEFSRQLAGFSAADEARTARAYRDAVGRADDVAWRTSRFGLAAATCPVVAEPCVWLAYDAATRGDGAVCRAWTAEARNRLVGLGTAWDKRLCYEEWREIIDALEGAADAPATRSNLVAHPRALHEAVVTGAPAERSARSRDAAAGRRRFQAYIEALAGAGGTGGAAAPTEYPGLASRPWHDAAALPLPRYLESNFAAIHDELLGLDDALFHRESERIARRGDWDVLFLYERGRRHDAVCDACPVTVRGIDTYPAMRSAAGLIYVSRMRGGTHIAAHRGPTNLRLRCHLALEVPDGDCAIRVGNETRRWEVGRCLVFDDVFEHEAWNDTGDDRIVLIVDLWHPDLTPTEVTLLEGLHNYTAAYARRLSRYWATNASAAGH